MTLKLTRSLWLWAAALSLALLWLIPLAGWIRAVAVLLVVAVLARAWSLTGRRFARKRRRLMLAGDISLPPATWQQPVVLVCGDGLQGLFGSPGQLALRTTAQGCYVQVPAADQLLSLSSAILARRPQWAGQLSVMFIVNPGEHRDAAELAGRVRSLGNQLAGCRKRGITLPLMLVSYLQTAQDSDLWFSWEAGQPAPRVYETGACSNLPDWQQRAPDNAAYASRLGHAVQVGSAAAWLRRAVLAHLDTRDGSQPLVCAITLVAQLPGTAVGNLWQQWLAERTGLSDTGPSLAGVDARLPFPDPLLNLLALRPRRSTNLWAGVAACWLFVLAAVMAMASSAWQNNLLLRQVSDDLRRYTAITSGEQGGPDQTGLGENAVAVLRQDAMRLDSYYRQGEPLALGLGLYRGEILRLPVLATIASHRSPAPVLTNTNTNTNTNTAPAVRLDGLSLFGTGSAELKPGSTKVLISALASLKVQAGWLIVIDGHTDASGNPQQNLELSRARAATVRDWMQRMGDIPDSCFAVRGYAASQPLASNDSVAGRAANRRVDIRLVPQAGACVLPAAGPAIPPPVASRGW